MNDFNTPTEPKLLSLLKFEITSIIGRFFLKRKGKFNPKRSPYLIDVGAGENYTDGWIHVDFYKNIFAKRRKNRLKSRRPEIETDLRFPLDCHNSVADGIYSGHFIEHLYPNQAHKLLEELYRILKPGCWLRINVPDLRLYVDFYTGKNSLFPFKYKAEAIGNLTQNFGHHSVWDEELLAAALESKGFVNIKKVEFGKEGSDTRLIKEQEIRKIETLVMEAQKPAL